MSDQSSEKSVTLAADGGAAAIGGIAGVGALLSAAACCVLPLGLAALGIGSGGLATIVPYHWPLTIVAALAVTLGWALYVRKRRACLTDARCATASTRSTLVLLSAGTVVVLLSVIWKAFLEVPLMAWLASA